MAERRTSLIQRKVRNRVSVFLRRPFVVSTIALQFGGSLFFYEAAHSFLVADFAVFLYLFADFYRKQRRVRPLEGVNYKSPVGRFPHRELFIRVRDQIDQPPRISGNRSEISTDSTMNGSTS